MTRSQSQKAARREYAGCGTSAHARRIHGIVRLVEIAAGAINAENAAKLYMAEGTVKTHIGRLLAKLEARDRVGLLLIAYVTGLVRR